MTLLLIALTTLITEDLACIGAGLMVAHGTVEFLPAAAACCVGIFVGDMGLYLLGRYLGRPAVKRAPLRWVFTEEDLVSGEEWFRRRGWPVLVISRFVPGTRLATYVAAGVLHGHAGRFAGYVLLAGLVWSPLLVWFAARLGGPALEHFSQYETHSLLAAAGAVIATWLVVKLAIPLGSFRGRRLLVGAWRRWTHWEFWPLWMFYPPVVVYILWLGLRHRCLTLFTAANPAIPGGGLVGESKAAILGRLPAASVAAFRLVQSAAEVTEFPVVLKSEAGQRGLGVAVVRTPAEAAAYFRKPRGPTIAQEYVAGHEFGVFYYRFPNADRGRIFSIAEKRMPTVTGDGRHSLEWLILSDERAVCLARFFLHRHRQQLDQVPAAGAVVALTELGTHCHGAVFGDGTAVNTPALEAAIDRISQQMAGFFIGRFDIRTPAVADFQRGENFKIIELNGVTFEATHIYHPGASVWAGWRTLFTQWRITFAIAAQNRARGHRPLTLRDVWRLVQAYHPASEA